MLELLTDRPVFPVIVIIIGFLVAITTKNALIIMIVLLISILTLAATIAQYRKKGGSWGVLTISVVLLPIVAAIILFLSHMVL